MRQASNRYRQVIQKTHRTKMNKIEKEMAESISLFALSLLENVIEQEYNNTWNDKVENLFSSSQTKVIQMLENYILKNETILNTLEVRDNLKLFISEVVKNNFNAFKSKFKNKNYE